MHSTLDIPIEHFSIRKVDGTLIPVAFRTEDKIHPKSFWPLLPPVATADRSPLAHSTTHESQGMDLFPSFSGKSKINSLEKPIGRPKNEVSLVLLMGHRHLAANFD